MRRHDHRARSAGGVRAGHAIERAATHGSGSCFVSQRNPARAGAAGDESCENNCSQRVCGSVEGGEHHGNRSDFRRNGKKMGAPSGFICPECNGPLWESKNGKTPHFRCLVGHAFSPESLLAGESETVERALWTAVKTL